MKTKLLLFITLIFSLSFLSACSTASGKDSDATIITAKPVKTVFLQKSYQQNKLYFTGSVESEKYSNLSFKTSGRIKLINIEVGDYVANGDILAELYGDELQISSDGAKKDYQNTISNLLATQNLMQAKIDSAKRNLDTLKLQLIKLEDLKISTNKIANHESELAVEQIELSKIQLNNLNSDIDLKINHLDEQKVHLITQALILMRDIQNAMYSSLDINLKTTDYYQEIDNRFGQGSSQFRTNTSIALRNIQIEIDKFQSFYDDIIEYGEYTSENIETGIELSLEALSEMKELLNTLHGLLFYTTSSIQLNQLELDEIRKMVTSYGRQIDSLFLSFSDGNAVGFEGLDQNIDSLNERRHNEIQTLESKIIIAEKSLSLIRDNNAKVISDLENDISVMNGKIEEAKQAIIIAEANLHSQTQIIRIQIDKTKTIDNLAKTAYDNTFIRAPFSGLITEKFIQENSVIDAGFPIITLVDPNNLKIIAFIDEENASKIQIGMKANIIADSADSEILQAFVIRMGNHADPISKKIPIEFKLTDKTSDIKVGTYVEININPSDKKSVLILPDEAILRDGENTMTYIIQNSKAYLSTVILGKRHTSGYEVKEGLYPKNEVVIAGMQNLNNGDLIFNVSHNE